MRVLQVCSYFYPALSYGGPIYSVLELCRELTRQGVDVTVFTTNLNGDGFLKGVEINRCMNIDGFRVYYYGWDWGRRFFFSRALWSACKKHIAEFDLVHIQGTFTFPSLIAAYYSQKYRVPYVVSPRGTLDPWSLGRKWLKKRICLWLYEKSNLRRAAALHFTTKNEMELASRYFDATDRVIVPNGIDLSQFETIPAYGKLRRKLGIDDKDKLILFMGRIHPKKGLDLLIFSFSKVIKEIPHSWLLLGGPDEEGYLDKILNLARVKGIKERIFPVGMLKGEEKLSAFVDSDLFVLPSYGGENFGMAVIEAMASGLPVIISDRVGISSDVERYQAGIVTVCKADILSGEMIRCLSDVNLCKKMQRNARRLVEEKYDISKVTEQMIREYKSAIKYAN